MFHGFDFDNTMLRIGSMNMLLHGVENPDIRYRDSLAQDHAGEEEKYTLVLANPPFAGSLDYENTAKDLLQIVKTKKTELLFLALFLRLLEARRPGRGHRARRRALRLVQGPQGAAADPGRGAEARRRDLPAGGVFKPYAGVSTAILLFTKTNSGGTDHVWFYDVKRRRLLARRQAQPPPPDKLGPTPRRARAEDHGRTTCPTSSRWQRTRQGAEAPAPRRASVCPRPTLLPRATT